MCGVTTDIVTLHKCASTCHDPQIADHISGHDMHRFRWLIRLLGLALFVAILYVVDLPRILAYLARANFWLVALSIILVVPHLLSKSWRWQVLLRGVGIDISLLDASRLYAIGQAAGFLTPGQAGDAVKAVYLRGAGHSLGRSLVTVVVDRLYDLLVVGGLALWGIFVFGKVPQGQTATIVAFVAGIALLFVLFASHGWQQPVARIISRVVPARFLRGRDPERTLEGLVLPPSTLLSSFIITIISFIVSYFRSWLLFAALGLNVPLSYFLAATSIAGIAAILPVTIGGVGTRDAAFVVLFSMMSYSAESAVALSTLVLLHQVTNWVVGGLAFLWKPMAVSESEATDAEPIAHQ
jgi:glycosyltransferase 2 family protein